MALLACGLSFVPKFPYIGLLFFYGIGAVSLLARTAIFYYYSKSKRHHSYETNNNKQTTFKFKALFLSLILGRKHIVAGSKSVFESIVSKSRTEGKNPYDTTHSNQSTLLVCFVSLFCSAFADGLFSIVATLIVLDLT